MNAPFPRAMLGAEHVVPIPVITAPDIYVRRLGYQAGIKAIADSWRCEKALRDLRRGELGLAPVRRVSAKEVAA